MKDPRKNEVLASVLVLLMAVSVILTFLLAGV